MAGICGVLGIEDEDLVKKMGSLMDHRGEVIDVFAENGVTIAIVHHSDEPKPYNDGSTCIALDQDIYAIGSHLVDNQSTIVNHLVSGPSYKDAIKNLRGSFALSIVKKCKDSKKLVLARDIYGTRSMYYLKIDHNVFFASEMKCFLAIDEFKPEVNLEALNYYLTCGFAPNRETLFKQVYKVLPAEIVEFEDGNFSYMQYWVPRPAEHEPSDLDFWAESTWKNLLNTTKTTLPAEEHKVGLALSGGLDSSLIAAALRRTGGRREIVGFSLDYGDNDNSELQTALKVAKHLDIDCHTVRMNAEQSVRDLERLQWIYDEPLIKFTFIPTYYLFEAAKKHVKTLFTGDGGDEQFLGYTPDYWEHPLAVRLFSKLGPIRRPLLRIGKELARPMARLTGSKILSLATEFFTRDYASHPDWQYRTASRVFQPYFAEEELPMLFKHNGFQGVTDKIVELINTTNSGNTIEKISQTMLTGKLPDDLLRLDKSVAATAVKVRTPLLDPKMTNLLQSIPIPLRYQNKTTKYLIRYLIKKYGLLPGEVAASRRKRGLTVPLQQWLTKSPAREYFEDLMESGTNSIDIDVDYVKRFWPPKTYTETLKSWNLIAILLWLKTFLPK